MLGALPRKIAQGSDWWVLLGFTLLTVVLTWPVTPLFGQAINAFGDVVVQMTTLSWDAHALATDPLHLFEAPFFYPYAHANAYSEHLLGEALVALPILWLTGNPAPAHNFNFLLSFVLTAFGTYLLVRDLTGSRAAAVAAGIAYAFAGYRFVQSGHLQTLATEWFPLTLWALRRGLQRNHGGYLALAAGFFVAMGLFSVYYVYFLALLVGLYLAWWLLLGRPAGAPAERGALPPVLAGPGGRRAGVLARRPLWLKGGLALLAAGAALVLLYVPYIQVNQELGFNRSVYEVQGWVAHWAYFGNVLPSNWLWVTLFPDMASNRGERQLFPGLLITLLAVVGLLLGGRLTAAHRTAAGDLPPAASLPAAGPQPPAAGPRWFRHERLFYLLMGAVAVVLTFGMTWRVPGLNVDVPLPYAWLYNWVPGFSALRVPVRFVALLNLALAVLGGYGWAALGARWPRPGRVLLLPVLALLTLEYVQVRNLSDHREMRPPATPVATYLAAHPGPVLELPMHGDAADVWAMYGVTYHWQPLVNGFSSFVPPGTVEIARAVSTFPDAASLALLQGLEVRHVVVHFVQYPLGDRRTLQKRLAATPALTLVQQGDDAVYELAPDPWAARIAAALPPAGYLWLGRGSTGSAPALETLAYALRYGRLADARLPVPAGHVSGDLPIGYRALPALPFGQPADIAVLPTGDPAGGQVAGAEQPFYANPLAAVFQRRPDLHGHYDLTAATSPYAPHGLALDPGGARFAPAGPAAAVGAADLLLAAFASVPVRVGAAPLLLAPGLTRYHVAGPASALDLSAAAPAGAAGPPALLAVDLRTGAGAPGAPAVLLTDTLVLDLDTSTADRDAGIIRTNWRVVPRHAGGGQFTLTLDVYQKPFGTHPDGHLGSWSLPLPAGAEGRSYSALFHPADKTATALLNGAPTEVFAWQGPPHGGDFAATLNLLLGDRLLAQLPIYDFTLDSGRLTQFDPAPGTVLILPFGGK